MTMCPQGGGGISSPQHVKAIIKKPKFILIDSSKAGKELHLNTHLDTIYEDGIIFTSASKRNNQKIKTALSLSVDALDEWKSLLPDNSKITPFVLEVLAHCATLKAQGNEYISSKVLFRQMNGGKDKKPTRSMYDALYQALGILACTRIHIDASQEKKAGYNQRDFYKGALLPNSIKGKEIITLNGSIIEDSIHILGQSPLYEYAIAKGQVSNIPVEMLDIPSVNSTEENIVLTGYLIRAYADMTNSKSDRNKSIIRYDTLFEYLGVQGSNPNQLRKNKAKIRATVRQILDTWIAGGFIKGYQELTEDNKPAKERIPIAKIRLEFFTAKELPASNKNVN